MTKRFIAAVLSASLAFTTLAAAPVSALDRGERNRLILGAGTLLLLGHLMSQNNNSDRGHVATRRHDPVYTDRDYRRRDGRDYRVQPRRKVLPSVCLRYNQRDHGPRRFFTQHCLSKNMRHVGHLPKSCRTKIRTHRGKQKIYAARCLRNNGWVFG